MTNFSYNDAIPATGDNPSTSQGQMLTNFASIAGVVNQDMIGFNLSNGGLHKQITFASNNTPSLPTTPPILFTSLTDGAGNALPGTLAQLFFYSGANTASSTQYVALATGSTFLFGGLIAKWGVGSFSGSSQTATATFVSAFPNSLFMAIISPFGAATGIGADTYSTASFRAIRSDTSVSGLQFRYFALGN